MTKRKSKPKFQECTVCGYKRKFTRMREKEGKDGRTARWPEYVICPRKLDPQYHPTSANISALLDEELRHPSVGKVKKKTQEPAKRPVGILYTTVSAHAPLDGLAECLLDFEEKRGEVPIAIGVRGDENDGFTEIDWELESGEEIQIPVWIVKLSKGFGYLFLITGME